MKYDVVIIGSGLGGLICAKLLVDSGLTVIVLEQGRQAGGCLQSYRRNGVTFDTGLHYVGRLNEGHRLHSAFSRLGLMDLPWKRLDSEGFDRITIGSDTYPLAEGFENFAETLSKYFPNEREGLRQYVAMLRHVDALPLADPEVPQLMAINAYDYLCSTLRDPILVNVVSGSATKLELNREKLPLFTFAHVVSSYIQSSWRLCGGGGLIIESLLRDIRKAGDEVVLGAEVGELVEQNGCITTARTTDGRTYEGNFFISDIHPDLTFRLVKESSVLKKLFRKRIAMLENTMGTFTVSLVLKPNSLHYFNHNKYVYRQPNVWTFASETDGIGGVMVSCAIPTDGSDDARQIDLLTPMPYSTFSRWENTSVGRRMEEYKQLKEQLADECVLLAERVIPGLASMVSHRYISTPLTWHDYTLTPQGSAFGIRKDYRQPLLTMLSPRTPIPNLLLTGQSIHVHGLEGVTMTALQTTDIINKLK